MSIFNSSAVSGNDFDILAYAASGMEAQRGALEVAAHNIALSQTASPGHPVKAYAPEFSVDANSMSDNPFASLVRAASGSDDDDDDSDNDTPRAVGGAGGIAPPYENNIADADDVETRSAGGAYTQAGPHGQGLVTMTGVKLTNTDINPITQMMDLINAQRAYESNASVFDLGKTLASKAIDLENVQ